MELLFGILVGFALCFIVVKAIEISKPSKTNDTKDTTPTNLGGGSGVGELPKNNIK